MSQSPYPWIEQTLEAVRWLRAPREPPLPAGEVVFGESRLERPVCAVCGAGRARSEVIGSDRWAGEGFAVGRRFAVVRCAACATRYTTPRLVETHKALALGARGGPLGAAPLTAHERRRQRRVFRRRAELIAREEPVPGRLLDLGAGDGFFLDEMRSRGFEVSGVDLRAEAVAAAQTRLGLEMAESDLERDPLPAGPFEVATLWGVLPMIYRPHRFLERLRAELTPNGLLAIGVSNLRSAGFALFRERWHGLALPRQLTHFTPETLTRLVEWAGYQVVARVFETPRAIVDGSVDAAFAWPGLSGALGRGVVRQGARVLLRPIGSTRFGDTMILLVRRAR